MKLSFLSSFSDLGLLGMRLVIGATYVWFGWGKLIGGPDAWERIGGAMAHLGLAAGPTYWGLAAALAEFIGGLLLIAGLWVRPAALALLGTMVVATVFKLQALDFAKFETVTGAFYPLSMAAVFFGLVFLGGGRFGLDGAGGAGRGRAPEAAAKKKD